MALLSPLISTNSVLLQHAICNALSKGSSLESIERGLRATSSNQGLRNLLLVPNTQADSPPDTVFVETTSFQTRIPLNRDFPPSHSLIEISEKGASNKAYHFSPCSLQISATVQVDMSVNPLRTTLKKLTKPQQFAIFEQLLAKSLASDFNFLHEIATDIDVSLETRCTTQPTSFSPAPQIAFHPWLVFNFPQQPDATPLKFSIGMFAVGTPQVPLLNSNSRSTLYHAQSLLIHALSLRTAVNQTPGTEIAVSHQLAPGLITLKADVPLSVGTLLSNWGKLRLNVGEPTPPPPVIIMLKAAHTHTGATTPYARVDLLDPYVPEDLVPTYHDQLQRYHAILQTLLQAHWLPMLTC